MDKLLYVPGQRPIPSGSQLVTLDDLERFRVTLMDINKMLEGHLAKSPKRWLKSHEVKAMLKISYSTLQMLRNTGKILFTRIGVTRAPPCRFSGSFLVRIAGVSAPSVAHSKMY